MWENRKPGVIAHFPIEGKVTKLIIQIQKILLEGQKPYLLLCLSLKYIFPSC